VESKVDKPVDMVRRYFCLSVRHFLRFFSMSAWLVLATRKLTVREKGGSYRSLSDCPLSGFFASMYR
jgi:hypothetical protein